MGIISHFLFDLAVKERKRYGVSSRNTKLTRRDGEDGRWWGSAARAAAQRSGTSGIAGLTGLSPLALTLWPRVVLRG
jgi:hypothetical protein